MPNGEGAQGKLQARKGSYRPPGADFKAKSGGKRGHSSGSSVSTCHVGSPRLSSKHQELLSEKGAAGRLKRPWAQPGQEDPSGEQRSWVGWESGLGASPRDLAHHLVSVECKQR